MARRRTTTGETGDAATETSAPPTTDVESNGESPIRRRRRRRTNIDHEAQTTLLTESVLKCRGGRGATITELQTVIGWARSVHAEAEEFRSLASQPRRRKSQVTNERQAAFELNKSLLESVLDGKLGVDIDESGSIVFVGG